MSYMSEIDLDRQMLEEYGVKFIPVWSEGIELYFWRLGNTHGDLLADPVSAILSAKEYFNYPQH